jgi:ABC-type Na+ efflux pump permease subunit
MRKALRLAKREYLASVKTKGFIIMLVLMPVLMGGSAIAMLLFEGKVDTKDKHVAVIDHSGIVADVILKSIEQRNAAVVFDKETGKKVQPAYIFEAIAPSQTDPQAQKLELSNRIRSGSLHAFLEIGPNVLYPQGDQSTFRIAYHARNSAMDNIRGFLNNPINTYLRSIRMTNEGVEESKVNEILTWIQVEALGLTSVDKDTGEILKARRSSEEEAFLVPFVLLMLMFMMFMMGAMPLLHTTMEEKTQRIAEVLLGCLKPTEFMAGKVIGGLGVSLTGAVFYVAGGIFFLRKIGLAAVIPYDIIPWFFIFLVLQIIMIGSLLASLGSACNDPKDAQNLTFPAMFPVMIPMFIAMPIIREPTSGFATLLSLIPPFTPMLMILRKAVPSGIPAWQPWVGLVGVLIFTCIIVWAGGRIFRVGILMQGGPPKLSKIFGWAFRR